VTKPFATPPAPFIKWVGGKRALLKDLFPLLPKSCGTYYEPFIGGGAVFFALAALPQRPWRHAVIADVNEELVRTYTAIRDQPRAVIRHLLPLETTREAFLRTRDLDPTTLADPHRAARLIYILKHGFNGLYRVNRKGRCNVPWGHRPNARICSPDLILADSWALRGIDIQHGDFATTLRKVRANDAVFADPPYVPLSGTSFTSFQQEPFGLQEHIRLATLLRALAANGTHVVATNSDCATSRELYAPFAALTSVPVTRRISASVASRALGVTSDLLIHARAA